MARAKKPALGRPNIDSLFPNDRPKTRDEMLAVSDLPYLARPLIEKIHAVEPEVIIAGDRGARLLALSVIKSWKYRYPGERLPTLDGKIHFARITSRSASATSVTTAVHDTLLRAGLERAERGNGGDSPKVVYLDDWSIYGGTIERFLGAAEDYGISPDSVHYLTMCGRTIEEIDHTVADPSRNPRWSEWDTYNGNARHTMVGVLYEDAFPTEPVADVNTTALAARQELHQAVHEYYQRFTCARHAGNLAATSTAY